MIVDVAHASAATIDDVPGDGDAAGRRVAHRRPRRRATTPATCRTSTCAGSPRPAASIGIGFWPTACGGDDAEAIARSIKYATDVAGLEHVALGSDFDGGVQTPFDATGLVQLTDALLVAGFKDDEIGKVMGGNAIRVLARRLPAT